MKHLLSERLCLMEFYNDPTMPQFIHPQEKGKVKTFSAKRRAGKIYYRDDRAANIMSCHH